MSSFDPDTSEKIQQPLLITFHKLLGKNVFGQTLQRSSMLCGISGQMYGNGRCLASWGHISIHLGRIAMDSWTPNKNIIATSVCLLS